MDIEKLRNELKDFGGGALTCSVKQSYLACNTNPFPKGPHARKIIYRVDVLADRLRVRMYAGLAWRDTLHALFNKRQKQLGCGWIWSADKEQGIEKHVSTAGDALEALNLLYDKFEKELRQQAANI